MAEEFAGNYQDLIKDLMRRTEDQRKLAESRGKGEAGRRGLVGSDIEMSLRRAQTEPVVQGGQSQIAQILAQIAEQQEARKYQTSERVAGQEYGTGERIAGQEYGTSERFGRQAYGTGEREAGQVYGTGEREAGQTWTGGQAKLQRDWQTGESALDRQAAIDKENRAASAKKRDWWKGKVSKIF